MIAIMEQIKRNILSKVSVLNELSPFNLLKSQITGNCFICFTSSLCLCPVKTQVSCHG